MTTPAVAQDTTWVQTFTFDSISTRRGDFAFPQHLNNMRFEKVLMYYKLKCSPLTPWDQYNCGEWDYLTYTRVFDHTGILDSVQVDSVKFLHNYQSSGTYDYEPWGYDYANLVGTIEHNRTGASLTLNSLGFSQAGAVAYPFDQTKKGGRYQMLVTAAELTAAGIVAGDIESIAIYINAITGNGELMHPSVSIKGTTDTAISDFHKTGFTQVYDLSKDGSTSPFLVTGENELLFYQPYTWNGTDNLIIEYSFDHSVDYTDIFSFDAESSSPGMAINYSGKNGSMEFNGSNYALTELSDIDLGGAITISFWAKGSGNTGVNTSILEGYDTLNNRVINIHMPWSNNRLYWDCGEGSGYDRIDIDMSGSGIDNEWHHWAFVKDQSTGEMKVLRDGVLFHNGTGLTRMIGDLHRLVIGSNKNYGNKWSGKIDEFQIFNSALDELTIANWYKKKIDATHPNWADLLVYYDFDEEEWAADLSGNDHLLMPSEFGMFDFSEYPSAGINIDVNRILCSLGTGAVAGTSTEIVVDRMEKVEPEVVFEFQPLNRHFEITNAFIAAPAGNIEIIDETGTIVSSNPYLTSSSLTNQTITYYQLPYEIIHDVEIGRYITPYGIQFDLGPNGFTWIYDVTDYQMYLKDTVDLAAHNTQELIDLKFAFIEGIPPRDVHKREPIWSDFRSYSYASMDNDVNLSAVSITLSDTSEMYKIKTRFTGHGHHGNNNCCEWGFGAGRDHEILVDGVSRFNWEIWEETACGDNPNISQGGTWPYAREGWCPGDMVKEYDHELTPYVTPGTAVTLDYDITDVPVSDPAQGNGNYIVAMDLISYSAPNFQNDAAIIDVLNPNNYEYYGKWNPGCQNPRLIIQNTGEQDLTSCVIRVYISASQPFDYTWTGSLSFLEKEIVEIPIPGLWWWNNENPNLSFTAEIIELNGGANIDEYPHNNMKNVPFEAPEYISGQFLVWFNTNNKAHENKWRLEDSDGNIIFDDYGSFGSLQNTTTYKDTFDLEPGCYSIILEDNDNDGIGFWYSSQVEGETTGTFRVRIVGGGYIEFFPADFGNFHRYNFTVGYEVGLNEKYIDHDILIYPNPTDGLLNVELSGFVQNEAQLEVYDLMGRKIYSGAMNAGKTFASSAIDLTGSPTGHYVIKVKTGASVYTKEFVIQ